MDSFWAKVDKRLPDECWPWTASRYPNGYGQIRISKTESKLAHRLAYELTVGPIPDGMDLDHLCRNRGCVNPAHLEPVTRRTNLLRGQTVPARNALKTHCKNGHPFDAANTILRTRTDSPHPRRICRICYETNYRQKNAERAANTPRRERQRPTHCPQSHEYTTENTYVHPATRKRHCKTCSRASSMRSYYKKRAAMKHG